MNELFKLHVRKFLYGLMAVGLALSMMGASLPSSVRPLSTAASISPEDCLTKTVLISLAAEQISFCAPTSLAFNVVEDSTSDPSVNYAGLAQGDGYGIVNIKATSLGSAPGTGRPVYTSGGAQTYRKAVMDMESARTDRTLTSGPAGLFWNESVPGIQEDLTLPTSAGDLKIRSIEWYVEHNHRLWSFILTWDTALQNASEWQAAAGNIVVETPLGRTQADTATNLGRAVLQSPTETVVTANGAPVDVSSPSWWSGTCDNNNYFAYTGIHSKKLTSWHGVAACGPVPTTDHPVAFFPGAITQYEFESVELVMRFLYLQWEIVPWAGVANTIKNNVPAALVFKPNDGTHQIVSGDILTENASTQNPNGHTMVVTGISVDANGTGTVTFMEQNASTTGTRSLSVQNWQVQPDAFVWGQTIQGVLHVKGNQDDGDFDPTFTPGTGSNGRINAIALKANGKIMIAGNFTSYNGTSINRIARLNLNGTLDTSFNQVGVAMTSDTPHVNTLVVYPTGVANAGEMMIGGHFDSYNGTGRKYIARLNSDGTLDTTFLDAAVIDRDVYTIAIQPDGNILAGGVSTLRRMISNGKPDSTFLGNTDGDVYDIVLQADGKIIVGGSFSKVDGVARAGIARLNSNGTLDTSFNPGSGTGTGVVNSISLDPNGRMVIGGDFTTYNGVSRNKIARLNNNGSLDTSFDPGTGISKATNFVQTVLAESDGRVLAGGTFNLYNGATVTNFVRLNYNGSLDTTFYDNLDGFVQTFVLQPDAKILISGSFTDRIARLLNHISACYSLTTQVSPAAGGTINVNTAPNCAGSKYLAGTQVQVTAVPNANYSLVNWSGDASGLTNPFSLTMNSDKTVTANFMTAPAAFVKIAPADGATGQPASLTFVWGSSTGAASYEYCLDNTDNDTCDSGNWISTGTSTSVALSDLFPSVSYFWQVRARNVVGTTEAGAWFTFGRNGIPAVPVTIFPSGGIVSTLPVYAWKESNGASSYHLQVVDVNAPATFLVDTPVDSSACVNGVCTYPSVDELPRGNYEFRVSASATGTSAFSAWRTFTIGMGTYLPLILR